MQRSNQFSPADDPDFLCPDITANWLLDDRSPIAGTVILQAKVGNRRYQFDAIEGYALKHFTGQYTASQVLRRCQSHLGTFIPSDFPAKLLQKLVDFDILPAPVAQQPEANNSETPTQYPPSTNDGIRLKSTVEWIPHPDGYWILRNPEDVTYLKVDDLDKEAIEQLGQQSFLSIVNQYDLSLDDLQYLVQMLAATGMLEGTKPPKPPWKFSLLQLLYCKIPLFKPDAWLAKHVDKLDWIWTWQFSFALCAFISTSVTLWLALAPEIATSHRQVWAEGGTPAILTLCLLTVLVVSLHELGHAFTLKHYGGIVPEIGLLLMCLIPGCYTNTTDQYSLVRRKQRVLVVAAGVLVQIVIWAVAVWVWILSKSQPWLHEASYLLMAASLLTVVLNLNPLNRFDGYYLLVAWSGIDNLRERSLQFYGQFLRREEILEEPKDCWILAAYAPFSLAYAAWIFFYLLSLLGNWILQNLPAHLNFTKFPNFHF